MKKPVILGAQPRSYRITMMITCAAAQVLCVLLPLLAGDYNSSITSLAAMMATSVFWIVFFKYDYN
jgi:hypothetical protein